MAVGRTPRTRDLGLDLLGVETDERGFVVVDDHLRTTNPRVWAAGDLTGHPQFTHTAGSHGSLAASNAVLGVRRSVDLSGIPRVTYTQPEVAAVGLDTARERPGLRVLSWSHEHVDRAVAEGRTDGLTKLVVDRRGRILGGLVVGPRAGETLGEIGVAVTRGLRTRDLAGVIHAYPTWNDGPWNAALARRARAAGAPGDPSCAADAGPHPPLVARPPLRLSDGSSPGSGARPQRVPLTRPQAPSSGREEQR